MSDATYHYAVADRRNPDGAPPIAIFGRKTDLASWTRSYSELRPHIRLWRCKDGRFRNLRSPGEVELDWDEVATWHW